MKAVPVWGGLHGVVGQVLKNNEKDRHRTKVAGL
jgi:hypothetical protein